MLDCLLAWCLEENEMKMNLLNDWKWFKTRGNMNQRTTSKIHENQQGVIWNTTWATPIEESISFSLFFSSLHVLIRHLCILSSLRLLLALPLAASSASYLHHNLNLPYHLLGRGGWYSVVPNLRTSNPLIDWHGRSLSHGSIHWW